MGERGGKVGLVSKRRWQVLDKIFHCFPLPVNTASFEVHVIFHKVTRGKLIIQLPCRVRVLSGPLQAPASFLPSLFCDRLNDLASVALSTECFIDVKICNLLVTLISWAPTRKWQLLQGVALTVEVHEHLLSPRCLRRKVMREPVQFPGVVHIA